MFGNSVFILTFVFAVASANIKYKPILEKCEMGPINAAYVKNAKLDCHKNDDGHFTISSSGEVLQKINLDDLKATAQVYALENNEYVKKEKAQMSLGLCSEYKMQSLGNWQEIEKHGNLKGCGVLEPGSYHVTDYPPKIKFLDLKIPEGRYKLNTKLNSPDFDLLEMDFYVEIQHA